MSFKKISLVIPVYNEAENLFGLFDELEIVISNLAYSFEVVIVDDGSTDESWGLIASYAAGSNHDVKGIRLMKNYGQTAAIQVGFENISGDVAVVMDSDLQNDPADIPRLIAKLEEGFDVVTGYRSKRKDSLIRKMFSFFGNYMIRKFTGLKIHDAGCSLKAYKRDWVESLKMIGEMHRILIVYLFEMGAKISEIEVNHRKRTKGSSKYGTARVIKLVMDLILYKFFTSFVSRPIYMFGGAGFFSIVLSIAVFVFVIYRRIVFEGAWMSPLFFISVTLFTVGIMFIMLGILAEIMVRVYYQTKYGFPYKVKDRV